MGFVGSDVGGEGKRESRMALRLLGVPSTDVEMKRLWAETGESVAQVGCLETSGYRSREETGLKTQIWGSPAQRQLSALGLDEITRGQIEPS